MSITNRGNTLETASKRVITRLQSPASKAPWILGAWCVALFLGASAASAGLAPPEETEKRERIDFEWLGQEYKLGRQSEEGGTSREEYYPSGESPEDWSQCISVQSIPGKNAEALTARLQHNKELQIRVSREEACIQVLRIHHEGTRQDPQEAVMLIQKDLGGERLKVITYIARSAKLEPSRLQMQLTAWMERFLTHPAPSTEKPGPTAKESARQN